MATTYDGRSEPANEAGPTRAGAAPAEARDGPRPSHADATARPDHQAADAAADPPSDTPPPAAGAPAHPWRKWLLLAGVVVGLAAGGYFLIPYVETMLSTVSTDDAYVNGHVTLVAPRVAGLVSRVLVDDNYRVKKGALLVQLDKEPYQVQVDIKKAAVVNAEADLEVARSQVRGTLALARSQRWKLQRSMEDVDDTVAQLRARVAALRSKEATLDRARADFARAKGIFSRNALSREDFDQRLEAERTAAAGAKQALEDVHEARVALGLAPRPESGRPGGSPRRPQPDLLRGPRGAGRAGPEPGAGRPPPHLLFPDAPASPRGIRPPRQGGEHRPHHGADRAAGAGGPAGRGQAPPGPARPRPGGAEPPLLRRRQRDRWHGDPPQRQPRQ